MAAITKLLHGMIEENKEENWTKVEQSAFENLRSSLLYPPVLTMFDQSYH